MQTPEPTPTPPSPRSWPRVLRVCLRRRWRSWRLPWSWPTRLAFLYAGVLLPLLCFGTGFPMQPTWQIGSLSAYARMLLTLKLSGPLLPLLLYSMTSLTLLIVAPNRFVKRFAVRFGVYTGVLLAVQYWVLVVIAIGGSNRTLGRIVIASLGAVAVPWFLGSVGLRLHDRFGTVVAGGAATLILALVVTLWPAVVFLSELCATPWAIACYGAMSAYALRHSGVKRLQFSLAQLLGASAWLAGFLGAWRASVVWMLQEYAQLPTNPPPGECYVCTAAARGHRRLVGAEDCATASGVIYRANDQMRYLKAAELLLAAGWPRAHGACRWVYDRIGPAMAARLRHPLLADAAYLALKPAEWLARAAMAVLLPGQAESIRGLYAPCRAEAEVLGGAWGQADARR